MLLSLFHLTTRKWEGELPFPNRLAGAEYPDVAYAQSHQAPVQIDACALADGAAQASQQLSFDACSRVTQQLNSL